jgi:hypothetical protein
MTDQTEYRLGKYSVRMTPGQAAHWNKYGPFFRVDKQDEYKGAEIRLGEIWFPFRRVFRDSGLREEIQCEDAMPLTSSPPAL